jgi:hypothetical protein
MKKEHEQGKDSNKIQKTERIKSQRKLNRFKQSKIAYMKQWEI